MYILESGILLDHFFITLLSSSLFFSRDTLSYGSDITSYLGAAHQILSGVKKFDETVLLTYLICEINYYL